MAYNYQRGNYYQPCGNHHQCPSNKANNNNNHHMNSCCCYSQPPPTCCCCNQNGYACSQQYCNHQNGEDRSKPTKKNQRALRKSRLLSKCHSSSCTTLGFDFCGDNKEINHRNGGSTYSMDGRRGYDCKRNCHHSSYNSCCSSSRKAPHYGEEKRCRREPQPRHLAPSGCDINRLISMVRNPHHRQPVGGRCCHCAGPLESCDDEFDSPQCSNLTTSVSLPPLPPPPGLSTSEYTDCELDELPIEQVYRHPSIDVGTNIVPASCFQTKTRVKFMPPPSCFLLVKAADAQQRCKKDRQVQVRFDISSDFCVCSQVVCENCAKKVMCTCDRIRCCMCGKLKTTVDRKVPVVSVCRCPKSYRCCEMASSFLRFNSSPALNKDARSCYECKDARRPLTY